MTIENKINRKRLFGFKGMSEASQDVYPLQPEYIRKLARADKSLKEKITYPVCGRPWIYADDFLEWLECKSGQKRAKAGS